MEDLDDCTVVEFPISRGLGLFEHGTMGGAQRHREPGLPPDVHDQADVFEVLRQPMPDSVCSLKPFAVIVRV